jgi:SAM-dependent methyltransferase
MAQNIYDQRDFFEGYSGLARSVKGLDGAPEWPAIRAMLPALDGRRIVDLGCGFGWFARWARAHGATSVLGLDLSENMLARARSETTDPAVHYAIADLENLELPPAASISRIVRLPFTMSRISIGWSARYIARLFPARISSSPSSIRSTWRPRDEAGWRPRMDAEHGRSITTRSKASDARIG